MKSLFCFFHLAVFMVLFFLVQMHVCANLYALDGLSFNRICSHVRAALTSPAPASTHSRPVNLPEFRRTLANPMIIFRARLDPFIKVVLLFDGKKVKKKKTSTRKQETNPVYNECMMFDVPPDLLHRVLFVISVADSKSDSARSEVIGRVVIGSATTGESLRHWHQMLISPRRPVAAWHRLRL